MLRATQSPAQHLCTMVAPVARAMRLLSVLRRRRMAEMPAFVRKCMARSLRPFSVTTRSGLCLTISWHCRSMYSSSNLSSAALEQRDSTNQATRPKAHQADTPL
jgi:hypothetical protein